MKINLHYALPVIFTIAVLVITFNRKWYLSCCNNILASTTKSANKLIKLSIRRTYI